MRITIRVGSRAGQQMIEVVLFTVMAILVAVAMRTYLISSVSGRVREAADQFGYGRQYEPYDPDPPRRRPHQPRKKATMINGREYGPCPEENKVGLSGCKP